jgi:hypothetical protein
VLAYYTLADIIREERSTKHKKPICQYFNQHLKLNLSLFYIHVHALGTHAGGDIQGLYQLSKNFVTPYIE